MAVAPAALILSHVSASIIPSRFPAVTSVHLSKESQFRFVKVLTRSLRHALPIRHVKCAATGSNGRQGTFPGDASHQEPFWLSMVKDVAWSLRSLVVFLAEQPGQLKYIEWPTFQSTLKTAALTLVLVALLIVALSSIDALLAFTLALLLRKAA